MTEALKSRPQEGDLVRMIGILEGPMEVKASALGEDHVWESVRNGIYCTWYVDGEELFEVFQPGQIEFIVKRKNRLATSLTPG